MVLDRVAPDKEAPVRAVRDSLALAAPVDRVVNVAAVECADPRCS